MNNWHNLRSVFDDFLNIVVSAFSRDEENYMKLIWKYTKDEAELFSEWLADLVILMENWIPDSANKYDVLWSFYESHISLWHNWQFFTPEHITDFMSEIVWFDSIDPKDNNLDNNIKTVCDPCCWSWRLLLSHVKLSRKFWWKYYYYWSDIDKTCCLMAIINLFLNWANWEIYWMNALSFDIWEWRKFGFHKWLIPYLYKLDLTKEEVKETTEKIIQEQEKILKNYSQQSLF